MNLDDRSTSTTSAHDDLWRVQLATGEVRAMTLDALDEAFQAGSIGAATKVLAPGETTWAKLADVAGLDGDATHEPHEPAESRDSMDRIENGVPSLSPMATDVPLSGASLASLDLSAYDPSLRVPADFEIDENALKAKKGRVGALLGVGVAALVGLLFAGAKLAGNLEAVASSNAMRPSAAAPPAAVDVMDVDARARALSEEQKKRLLEADKARESTHKAKPSAAPAAGGRGGARPAGEKGAPFVNGGDKYDPLNGAL